MKWKVSDRIDESASKELEGYPSIVQQLLYVRGIDTKKKAKNYLDIDSYDYYDPYLIAGMNSAVERILEAKEKNEKVFIYGDYDVDGVMATSILWDYLYRRLGVSAIPYIPSRFTEGYGLGEKGLDKIIKEGGNLIISVDCGIRDLELVKKYSREIDFIITDHHTIVTNESGEKKVSEHAVAVVHPSHPESNYPFPDICGAAVAWKLVKAFHKKYSDRLHQEIEPSDYIDLVSLATVTDIMPLQDENRKIVSEGLKRIAKTENLGLKTLMVDTGIDMNDVQSYHYGFVIGPRINAAGRIEDALDAVRLLSTDSQRNAAIYSQKLNILNSKRQRLTQDILQMAEDQIEKVENKIHVVWGEEWPEGVVGLVAGKLQEKYYRPVLVASVSDGVAVGSARSIGKFNVTEALDSVSDILLRYGGHAQAAGFSLREDKLQLFKKRLERYADKYIQEHDLIKQIRIDTKLKLHQVNLDTIEHIDMLKPFGYGNSSPVFQFDDCVVDEIRFIGKEVNHIKLKVSQTQREMVDVIGFRMANEFKNIRAGDTIDLIGSIDKNEWNGRINVQIKLKDFKHHG